MHFLILCIFSENETKQKNNENQILKSWQLPIWKPNPASLNL